MAGPSSKFRNLGLAMGRLLVPDRCVVCRTPGGGFLAGVSICDDCQTVLCDQQTIPCQHCGARVTAGAPVTPVTAGPDASGPSKCCRPADRCRHCRDLTLNTSSVACLGNYEGPMRQLVLQLKRRGQESLAIQLGRWLGIQWSRAPRPTAAGPDLIVPVPVFWLRKLKRGYNVAELLAEGMTSTMTGHPRRRQALQAVRQTRKQGTLTTRQRFANVQDCFKIPSPDLVQEKKILLVDDVMTSGATASQATRTLLDAGASEVHLAVVARGVGRHA